jgi:hypothetical protein
MGRPTYASTRLIASAALATSAATTLSTAPAIAAPTGTLICSVGV